MMKKAMSALLALGMVAVAGAAFASDESFLSALQGAEDQVKANAVVAQASMAQSRLDNLSTKAVLEGISGISYDGKTLEVNENTPWDMIKYPYMPSFVMYGFENWGFTIDGLCVNGGNLELKGPQKTVGICRKFQMPPFGGKDRVPVCVQEEQVFVSIPVVYKAEECVEWSRRTGKDSPTVCVRTEIKTIVRALTQNVDVYKVINIGKNSRRDLAFTKAYTIPACK